MFWDLYFDGDGACPENSVGFALGGEVPLSEFLCVVLEGGLGVFSKDNHFSSLFVLIYRRRARFAA